jgi:transposase
MAEALSFDLRRRVIAAIKGGMSCRQAADRFGVSASSAIRWHAQERKTGDARPKPQGGDRRSGRIEAYAAFILSAVNKTPDITLTELQRKLAKRGIGVGISTLWRFFKRHRITLKKRLRTPRNRIVPIS